MDLEEIIAKATEAEYLAIATQVMRGGAVGFSRTDKDHRRIAQAALQALSDAGYVVVPREPTPAMLGACDGALKALIESYPEGQRPWRKRRSFRGYGEGYKIPPHEKATARWSAMIAAAPKTPPNAELGPGMNPNIGHEEG